MRIDKSDVHCNVHVYEETEKIHVVDLARASVDDMREEPGAAVLGDSVHLISSLQRS